MLKKHGLDDLDAMAWRVMLVPLVWYGYGTNIGKCSIVPARKFVLGIQSNKLFCEFDPLSNEG